MTCTFCHKRRRVVGFLCCQRCLDFQARYIMSEVIPHDSIPSDDNIALVMRELDVDEHLARLLLDDQRLDDSYSNQKRRTVSA